MNLEDYLKIKIPAPEDVLDVLKKNTGLIFIRAVMSRIPEDCRNEEFYLRAIRVEAQVFHYLGKCSPEFIKKAVATNGLVIAYIDHRDQTLELALIAVNNNGLALKNLSPELISNYQICEAAVRNNPFSLKYINNQSDEICLLAVSINGEALEFVKSQTPRISVVAFRNNPDSSRFVHRLMHPNGIAWTLEATIHHLSKIVDREDNQKLIKTTIQTL